MEKLPLHESKCPWESDELSDYWAAPDDLRRSQILKTGYDPSLFNDVKRLFPDSFSDSNSNIVEPQKQSQNPGSPDPVSRTGKFSVKAIVAALASVVLFLLTILSDGPDAIATLSAIIARFRDLI